MSPRMLGWFAEVPVLVLLFASLWLFGTGAFCFESSFLSLSFHDRIATSPDCSLVHLQGRVNPKLWLVSNLAVSLVLMTVAQVVAVSYFKGKAWASLASLLCSAIASVFFWQLGTMYPESQPEAKRLLLLFAGIATVSGYAALIRRRPAP